MQRDYQEARGRETVAESNLQAEMTNQATLSKQGAKVDESALNALRAAQDKASGEVSNLRDKLQEISKQLGISEERTRNLEGKLQFTTQQLRDQPALISAKSQMEIAVLMKGSTFREASEISKSAFDQVIKTPKWKWTAMRQSYAT